MAIIWVIRHGQASFGAEDYDKLSDTGVRQGEITGDYFRKLGIDFQAVYTGTLKRQTDTANHTLKKMKAPLQLVTKSEFNEYDFTSIIESQLPALVEKDPSLAKDLHKIKHSNTMFQTFFGKIMKRWMSGDYDVAGVETYRDYKKRVNEGFTEIGDCHDREGNIAIFTSGGVVSVAMQLSLYLNDNEAMRLGWRIMNASISKFRYSNGRMNLLLFNQMSHLEWEKDNALLTYR